MALEDVQDPNAGRIAQPVVQAQARTAQVGQSARVFNDPLTQKIIDNSSQIIGEELNKELQKDYMRGQLMAAQGASIQEVRENAPLLERGFGQGATIAGAQVNLLQKAQEDYQLNLIENMEELRKMSPEEFRESQVEDLAGFLTGDPDTDAQMTIMSQDMFARAAQVQMPEHLQFVQEEMRDTYVAKVTAASVAYDAQRKAGFNTPAEESQGVSHLAELLIQPEGMYDENYQKAMGDLVITRLGEGDDIPYKLARAAGFKLDADQEMKVTAAHASWTQVRTAENAHAIGQMMDDVIDFAGTGNYNDPEVMKKIGKLEEMAGQGFKFNYLQVERILRKAENARLAKTQGAADARGLDVWLLQRNMTAETDKTMDGFFTDAAASAYFDPAQEASDPKGTAKLRQQVQSAARFHNRPNKMITNATSQLMNNPIVNGKVPNGNFDNVYSFYKDMDKANGGTGLFDVQFTPEQQAFFTSYESLVKNGDHQSALGQLALIRDNPLPTGFQDTQSYKDAAEAGVSKALGESMFSGPKEASDIGKQTLRNAYGPVYQRHYQQTHDYDAAERGTAAELRQSFYTDDNGDVHRLPEGMLMQKAGLPNGKDFGDALNTYIADNVKPAGFSGTVVPMYTDQSDVVFFNYVGADGLVGYKMANLSDIGNYSKEQRGVLADKQATVMQEQAHSDTLGLAKAHYAATTGFSGDWEDMPVSDDTLIDTFMEYEQTPEGRYARRPFVGLLNAISGGTLTNEYQHKEWAAADAKTREDVEKMREIQRTK